MIPPTATRGDMTGHGTPLFPSLGSVNVLVGGKSVWRASIDFHACPLPNVSGLHIGGMVLAIGKRILVNGFPVAYKGDMIIENGAVNVILITG